MGPSGDKRGIGNGNTADISRNRFSLFGLKFKKGDTVNVTNVVNHTDAHIGEKTNNGSIQNK